MRYTHIRKADLNLLAALQTLIEERSISRAAARMFLSQPAMSRVLDRLQQMLGDELLVRTRKGYEPTLRAQQLYGKLEEILPVVEGLLRGDAFNAASASDTFRIAATDYATSVLLPGIVKVIADQAPNVSIHVEPFDDASFRKLESNALDFALWVNKAPIPLRSESLFEEEFVCLVRADSPLNKKSFTLSQYLKCKHLAVTLGQDRQLVDDLLEKRGLRRTIRLWLPYFASAVWSVEQSDMVFTVPKRLAMLLSGVSKTSIVSPPREFRRMAYYQAWHPRVDHDPAHQWLRQIVKAVAVRE